MDVDAQERVEDRPQGPTMDADATPNGTTTTPDAFRSELLARLGLPAGASRQDVEAAHQALVRVLDRAPAEQQDWARAQLVEAEAVISLLDELDADAAAAPAGALATAPEAPASNRRKLAVIVVAGLVLAVGAFFGWHLLSNQNAVPGIDGALDPTSTSSAPALDQAKVGELMQKIAADPKDVASLQALAEVYFAAQDYKTSATFSQKVLALQPKNDVSLVALGAAQFNLGDNAKAIANWQKATAANAKNVEAWYDLGFAYLSQDKPDMAKVKAAWEQVVTIDPDSDIAKNVKTHLTSLASPSAAPAK